MGEPTPLSVELIRDLYGDATAFNKAWDDSVDDLFEFGLVLPEAIAPLKLQGRSATRSTPKRVEYVGNVLPRIELTQAPGKPRPMWRTLDDSVIARDEHGNARGGIRLPDIEVPLARWYGATKKNRLGGADEAFDLAKVRSLLSIT